jgi:hypothetical protein
LQQTDPAHPTKLQCSASRASLELQQVLHKAHVVGLELWSLLVVFPGFPLRYF